MRIRMLADNCDCWKAGDVFEVFPDEHKLLEIKCKSVGSHMLTNKDHEDITDIADFADAHEIVEN